MSVTPKIFKSPTGEDIVYIETAMGNGQVTTQVFTRAQVKDQIARFNNLIEILGPDPVSENPQS